MNQDSIIIQTHSGKFHADDVVAVTLLSNYFNSLDVDVSIIRSRDPKTFSKSDILVDVGGKYDPEARRFDHHQKSCSETWNDTSKIPLSSVGMVWKHYGKLILSCLVEERSLSEEDLENLLSKIYFNLIIELDANDNGISNVDGGKRNYWSNLNLPSIISSCNGKEINDEEQDEKFKKAMIMVTQILEIKFRDIIDSYINFKTDLKIVESLIDPELEYLIIPLQIPTIYKCLSELDPKFNIKFLIFCKDDEITVKTRGKKMFQNLVDILPDTILRQKLTTPEDLIFVHKNLFIAKCKTIQTALEIIKYSLEIHNSIFSKVKRFSSILGRRSLTGIAAASALGVVGGYLYLKTSDE